MTLVEVDAGSCGFKTRIEVAKNDSRMVGIKISSNCEAVQQWGDRLESVDWRECLGENAFSSQVFISAADCLKHPSCPVCVGLLKAIEVEVGASLSADTTIRFIQGE
ncbi:MAG: hypothetical protein SWH54_11270 [Thermodesulfobacteriota bacterium]|nr:hypothetical protein [Thermodesulfobacteriota bacterium]